MLHRIERKTQEQQAEQWRGATPGVAAQQAKADAIRNLVKEKTRAFSDQKAKILEDLAKKDEAAAGG